mmetsp:Transcript_4644/g.14330  ORF Transcript_4644/g.14330 Transcript_4644/m.14330 type:complete len:323 (-) Transcript_4644:2-970(-)
MHLIDKEDAGHELRDALVDVLVDDLVDLGTKLLGNFRLLRFHHLAHHRDQVLPALRARVGEVEVMERNVLHDLLLLVHVALGQRHILLRLEVKLGGVGVRTADALDGARVGFDVDDVARCDLLLLDGLVDGRVELQLLRPLGRLEADHHMRDGLAIPSKGALRLLGNQLGNLALVDLLGLLDAQTDRAPKVLHQHLRLLDLGGVDLGADHRAEGHLGAKLMRDRKRERRLARARRAGEQQRAAGHLLCADQLDDDAASLARLLLADEAGGVGRSRTILVKPEALHVAVRRHALRLGRRLYLLDLHGARRCGAESARQALHGG